MRECGTTHYARNLETRKCEDEKDEEKRERESGIKEGEKTGC